MGVVMSHLLGAAGLDRDLRALADGGGVQEKSRLAPIRLDQGDP
jgi:hypothetical protein